MAGRDYGGRRRLSDEAYDSRHDAGDPLGRGLRDVREPELPTGRKPRSRHAAGGHAADDDGTGDGRDPDRVTPDRRHARRDGNAPRDGSAPPPSPAETPSFPIPSSVDREFADSDATRRERDRLVDMR